MVKLITGRAMLLGETSHDAGTIVEVLEDRAVELVALGHAAFSGEPPTGLEGHVAARRGYRPDSCENIR